MNLSPLPVQKFFGNDGRPLAGGKLFTYVAGTSTKQATYANSTGTQQNTNPIILDYRGEARVWLDPSLSYKFVLADSTDTDPPTRPIWSVDNIPGGITLTQAQFNALLAASPPYTRSAQEIAAGVVPVNFSYLPGDVRRYGAILDGATDDTTALQLWLSVGGWLTWPVTATAKVSAELAPVSNTTISAAVGAVIHQTLANANVMTTTSKSNILIEGLTFQAVGSMSSYFNGCGFHANGCTNIHIRDCIVTGHRGWGIQFYNSNECSAIDNRLINSPVSNSDNHTQCAGDIAVTGSSSRNVVTGNKCISGNGIGVSVHSLNSGDHADDNIVVANVIQNCKIYGSEQYQGDLASTVSGNIFNDNSVENISGAVQQITFGYEYGNGFYAVGADNFVVDGNRFKNTHSAAVVFVDLLAPGAIGVTNCGQGVINGNVIDIEKMYGITVRDPGAVGPAKQKVVVSNNVVSNVTLIGIQLIEKANVAILGNQIDGTGSYGVHINNTVTKRAQISICNNTVKGSTTGILASFMSRAAVDGNVIENVSVSGISIDNADDFSVCSNKVFNQAVYGIFIDSTCGAHTIDSNLVDGNATGTYGIYFSAKGNLSQTNRAYNCATANFFGNYNPRPGSTPAAGTWVQGDTIYYAGPSSGGNIGAVCTTGGSPGTWKTFGVIA